MKLILLVILLLMFPVASNSVYLMGSSAVSTLMLYCATTFLLFAIALAQKYAEGCFSFEKKFSRVPYYVTCMCMVFITYQHYLITNEGYSRQYYTYEQTYGYMNRVAYAIQGCEGYDVNMPVMLSGRVSNKELTMPEFENLNYITGIFGESDLVNGYSREEFIRRYCGLPIVKADDAIRDEILNTVEYKNMPEYPAVGSVMVIDGCCVVKLGKESL